VSAGTPAEYELDVTALELPSIAIVAQSSHFVKVLRSRTGQTPLQVRRASHSTPFAHSSTSADLVLRTEPRSVWLRRAVV